MKEVSLLNAFPEGKGVSHHKSLRHCHLHKVSIEICCRGRKVRKTIIDREIR